MSGGGGSGGGNKGKRGGWTRISDDGSGSVGPGTTGGGYGGGTSTRTGSVGGGKYKKKESRLNTDPGRGMNRLSSTLSKMKATVEGQGKTWGRDGGFYTTGGYYSSGGAEEAMAAQKANIAASNLTKNIAEGKTSLSSKLGSVLKNFTYSKELNLADQLTSKAATLVGGLKDKFSLDAATWAAKQAQPITHHAQIQTQLQQELNPEGAYTQRAVTPWSTRLSNFLQPKFDAAVQSKLKETSGLSRAVGSVVARDVNRAFDRGDAYRATQKLSWARDIANKYGDGKVPTLSGTLGNLLGFNKNTDRGIASAAKTVAEGSYSERLKIQRSGGGSGGYDHRLAEVVPDLAKSKDDISQLGFTDLQTLWDAHSAKTREYETEIKNIQTDRNTYAKQLDAIRADQEKYAEELKFVTGEKQRFKTEIDRLKPLWDTLQADIKHVMDETSEWGAEMYQREETNPYLTEALKYRKDLKEYQSQLDESLSSLTTRSQDIATGQTQLGEAYESTISGQKALEDYFSRYTAAKTQYDKDVKSESIMRQQLVANTTRDTVYGLRSPKGFLQSQPGRRTKRRRSSFNRDDFLISNLNI